MIVEQNAGRSTQNAGEEHKVHGCTGALVH